MKAADRDIILESHPVKDESKVKPTKHIIKNKKLKVLGNLRSIQECIAILHTYKEEGATDIEAIIHDLTEEVHDEYINRQGNKFTLVLSNKNDGRIKWGICDECKIELVYKFTDSGPGVLECTKCLFSKLATEEDANRRLTPQERKIFIEDSHNVLP